MLKNLTICILILGSMVFLSSVLFAEDIDTKILRESAVALQESDPVLSDNLKKFADEEAVEIEQEEENEEAEGQAEVDMEQLIKGHIKLLNESASALQKVHPELAKQLARMAEESTESIEDKNEGKEGTKDAEANEMKK